MSSISFGDLRRSKKMLEFRREKKKGTMIERRNKDKDRREG